MYYDMLELIKDSIVIILSIVFLFVSIFSSKNRFPAAILLLFTALLPSFIQYADYNNPLYIYSYEKNLRLAFKIDGLCAFALACFFMQNKLAHYQSALLIFATITHIMILLSLKDIHSSSNVLNIFFAFYDELIITIGLLQMWFSYDAILDAFRGVRGLVYRYNAYMFSRKYAISRFKKEKVK